MDGFGRQLAAGPFNWTPVTCAACRFVITSQSIELTQMPFANEYLRAIHFEKYGRQFGAPDELAYERMADEFMAGPMSLGMRECVRPNGTYRLRTNIANKHFGAAVVGCAIIRTYYIVPSHQIIRRTGTIIKFFNYECARADV